MSITPPIKFNVTIDNKRIRATVTEQIIPPVLYIFNIQFENGFRDMFSVGDDLITGEQPNSEIYAQALRDDIPFIIGLDPTKFYHVFDEIIEGRPTNIWIIEREKELGIKTYAVHYKRFYRFELIWQGDKWEFFTTAKIYPSINYELGEKIAGMLSTLLKK